jgi:hypothetical protein
MGKMKEYNMDDFYDQQIDNMLWGGKNALVNAQPNVNVDSNLKTAAAAGKPKMSDVPPIALFALGAAMSDGARKYGTVNWRATGSTSSVFYDAMMRHLVAWYSGEDFAEDSGIHHLAHLMASCAILLDSSLHNKLNDNRPEPSVNPLVSQVWKTNA